MRKNLNLFEKHIDAIGINRYWYYDKYIEDKQWIHDNKVSIPQQLPELYTTKEGYKVVKSTGDLCDFGLPVSCYLYSMMLEYQYIMIDDIFLDLISDDAKKVVIAHERGHLNNKHYLNAKDIIVDDINKEIEADAFAVSLYGKDIVANALEEIFVAIISVLSEDQKDLVEELSKIIETRISAILNK